MKNRTFTLVEMMVVIVIIMLVAGITFPVWRIVRHRIRAAQTKERIARIQDVLDKHHQARGYYPQSNPREDYSVSACRLTAAWATSWGRGLESLQVDEDKFLIDAWDRPIHYRCPGVMNPNTYDIWSPGKDGVTAAGQPDIRDALRRATNDDDITNWR